jgi:hypothetical protein
LATESRRHHFNGHLPRVSMVRSVSMLGGIDLSALQAKGALGLRRRFDVILMHPQVPIYIASQVLGAMCGSLIVYMCVEAHHWETAHSAGTEPTSARSTLSKGDPLEG